MLYDASVFIRGIEYRDFAKKILHFCLYSYLPLLWSFIVPTNMSNIVKEMGKCRYLRHGQCKTGMTTNLGSGKIRWKQMTRQ